MTCPSQHHHIARNMLRTLPSSLPASPPATARCHHYRLQTAHRQPTRQPSSHKAARRLLSKSQSSVVRHAGAAGASDLPDQPTQPNTEEYKLPPAKGLLLFNSFPSISEHESISSFDDGPAADQSLPSQDGATLPGPSEPPQGGMSHRWKVTWTMAIAFILCNLDKVCDLRAHAPLGNACMWADILQTWNRTSRQRMACR